jgi:hypothetical protein
LVLPPIIPIRSPFGKSNSHIVVFAYNRDSGLLGCY